MANTVQWQDLFVVIDDGHVSVAEYERIEPLVKLQAKSCKNGLACLVIIPEQAIPPPARVRQHLQGMLSRLPMRALTYLVEGSGFKAAAVRAVLISLGIFQRDKYPTKVLTSLQDALEWLLTVPGSKADVRVAMRVIGEARNSSPPRSAPGQGPATSRRMVK
jgi:hypothetical protein